MDRQSIKLSEIKATLATYGAGLRLKNALLTTDHVPDAILRRVEAAWGCTVYNHYGMTEMGLGGGVECLARRGYHLREADLLFEVVNPRTGAPVAEGETGEIVFTTLTRRGMPLIRYRTGDIGRFLPGPCPCGTTLKTLARVTHRADGEIRIGGSTFTLADLDEALFALPDVLNFTVTIERDERDTLRIELAAIEAQGDAIRAEAQTALEAIPPIALAVCAGRLALTVSVHPTGYSLSGLPKRSIARRSGANRP